MRNLPNFKSRSFINEHIDSTLQFYEPNTFDPNGGFYHYYLDNGTVYNKHHRHLVSATRFIFNWCMAYKHTKKAKFLDWAKHGWAHLQKFKLSNGLYAWTIDNQALEDTTIMAYGQAFVLLAASHAHSIGICPADEVSAIFNSMEKAFYQEQYLAYADEITPEGQLIDYRGQNANMHTCEACLAAFEATQDTQYLDRAISLIERFAFDLAKQGQGLIWEHYNPDWSVDWEYNKDNPGNIYKPWGFQTGHQTEWSKLLLIANAHRPNPQWVKRAEELHQAAYEHGWDDKNGGLVYGFDPEYKHCDTDKYFWVQAESFASAWRLWQVTGKEEYLDQYLQTWKWSWQHMIDHQYGAWFRILSANGSKLEDTKSPAGKTDYHTMGACWDVLITGGLEE